MGRSQLRFDGVEDLVLLAPNEDAISEAIPAFYRVHLRRTMPGLLREGPAQYPRSALPRFLIEYGGYLYQGRMYRGVRREGGRLRLDLRRVVMTQEEANRFLDGEARVTSPHGAAESAIAINPVDPDIVIAGTNGPGSGQQMHYSSDGGETWTQAAALPQGGTCCDPTVAWSSDGDLAFATSLGDAVFIYRSSDNGQTWDDFESVTPGDPRREIGDSSSDKEYLRADIYPTSPHLDNLYLTWHEGNSMKFSRSTDFGDNWSTVATLSSGSEDGIGSDIATDKSGNVFYFWPAFTIQKILVRKSTDGGMSFAPTVEVVSTQASFTFPIPSIEAREVFISVSTDVDLTDGSYADSLYAAWTDSTSTTTGSAANNHARIQVAYSRDGGASWTVVTPHETADALTVDRWHPWLSVAPDGSVHVVFYDTRRDATRTSVDVFHSISTDGAQTFSTPVRLTSVQSPNIADSFEFGDYNGLDAGSLGLLSIFTDNRDESDGSGNSVDVYTASTLLPGADLAISKDDGVTQVEAGGELTYTIVAQNLGPDDVASATVSDAFPAALSCSWTCVFTGGASCSAGPTVGDIADSVGLPMNGAVTYTAVCDVDVGASGTVSNTATVSSPVNDPTPGNDSATDNTDIKVSCLPDRVLTNETIDTPSQVEQACNSITAGPAYSIVAPGEMTFRAGSLIALADGFSVGTGATFTAELDPALGAASALMRRREELPESLSQRSGDN